jgi:hypothetical protein
MQLILEDLQETKGRRTHPRTPFSSYSISTLPHQSSLLRLGYLGSCPELYFVKEYNIFISDGLAYGEIYTVSTSQLNAGIFPFSE